MNRQTNPCSPSHPSSVALCLWSVPLFRRRRQILRWHGLWCGSWHPEQAACRLWLGGSDEAIPHQLQSEHEHGAGAGDGPLQQPALHHPGVLRQHSEGHKGTAGELANNGFTGTLLSACDVLKIPSRSFSRARDCLTLTSILILRDPYCLYTCTMVHCQMCLLKITVRPTDHWFHIFVPGKQYMIRGSTPLLNDYRGVCGENRYRRQPAQRFKSTILTPPRVRTDTHGGKLWEL